MNVRLEIAMFDPCNFLEGCKHSGSKRFTRVSIQTTNLDHPPIGLSSIFNAKPNQDLGRSIVESA
ncbi:hypothetical protein CHS0354_022685 [Potamilus streckersoni]|uniref:Uncharacterized protein n=1 Tax=Potamilus streckersoni TaxID=2493646 RepID=A0AAE0S7Q8_9BIVA|nr:hypothetical protein CHS0354_022685 [Potamilus streckersoni]